MINIVKGCRIMLGLKQLEMANKLGLSRQSYFLRESGKIPFSDKEKILFMKEVKEVMPKLSLEDIFFTDFVGK